LTIVTKIAARTLMKRSMACIDQVSNARTCKVWVQPKLPT